MNVHIPSLMNDRFRNTWRYLAARAWEEEHGELLNPAETSGTYLVTAPSTPTAPCIRPLRDSFARELCEKLEFVLWQQSLRRSLWGESVADEYAMGHTPVDIKERIREGWDASDGESSPDGVETPPSDFTPTADPDMQSLQRHGSVREQQKPASNREDKVDIRLNSRSGNNSEHKVENTPPVTMNHSRRLWRTAGPPSPAPSSPAPSGKRRRSLAEVDERGAKKARGVP